MSLLRSLTRPKGTARSKANSTPSGNSDRERAIRGFELVLENPDVPERDKKRAKRELRKLKLGQSLDPTRALKALFS